MRNELTTKEGIANVRAEPIRPVNKFTVYFLVMIFTVIFLNPNALEFLVRLPRLVP